MKEEILEALKRGALNALRLYAAYIMAPFHIGKAFMSRPPGEPFRWPPEARNVAPSTGNPAHH